MYFIEMTLAVNHGNKLLFIVIVYNRVTSDLEHHNAHEMPL